MAKRSWQAEIEDSEEQRWADLFAEVEMQEPEFEDEDGDDLFLADAFESDEQRWADLYAEVGADDRESAAGAGGSEWG